MRGSLKVIDTTRHVVEPADLWDKKIGKPYTGTGIVQVDQASGIITVNGRPVNKSRSNVMSAPLYQKAYADAIKAGFSAKSNLADMDKEGVDVAILLPTHGLHAVWADHVDGTLASAMCIAYNDWLSEYCQTDSKRLKGIALLPIQEPSSAVEELRRAVKSLGFVAAFMRPNPLLGRRLHDPSYDVIYAEAESLGVPIVLSELGGSVLHQIGVDRFDTFFTQEAVLDPFEMMLAFTSFMGQNVLERFPNLNIGYLGAGVGWIPYWLDRVDEHWGGFFGSDAQSTQAPSLLFKTQGFASADPWEKTLPEVLEECGESTIVWGSQYPFPEVAPFFPNELDTIVNEKLLTEDQKKAVLWDNAAKLFGISG